LSAAVLEATQSRLKRSQSVDLALMVAMPTRVVDYRLEEFDVFVGPNTVWDNPYTVGVHGDRARVTARYELWLSGQPDLLLRLGELRGKRLGCKQPRRPCHGHVLARMADAADPVVVEPIAGRAAAPSAGTGVGSIRQAA
jgi:hypothetical protein